MMLAWEGATMSERCKSKLTEKQKFALRRIRDSFNVEGAVHKNTLYSLVCRGLAIRLNDWSKTPGSYRLTDAGKELVKELFPRRGEGL